MKSTSMIAPRTLCNVTAIAQSRNRDASLGGAWNFQLVRGKLGQ
jgi:hypothetical protein